MKYFTLAELCASATAQARQIDNTPPICVTQNLKRLVEEVLDPVRELYGSPILVNSGYRCPALNAAVNGAKSSQHLTGQAADITTGNTSSNRALFDLIRTSGIPYDQLIDESNYSWIHISTADHPRRQILHL